MLFLDNYEHLSLKILKAAKTNLELIFFLSTNYDIIRTTCDLDSENNLS